MPVCVLIPVYNAPKEVRRCLESVVAYTPSSVSILIIDDASTDPQVDDVLATVRERANLTLVRNEANLGFTATVNRGLELAGEHDVVLLNSDTRVTPRWLAYLAAAAYERDDIATATAVSNSASQFSVPLRFHNAIPYWLDPAGYARAIAQCDRTLSLQAPFGHGFCLYVKRRYLDSVGVLDVAAFPRGYGEEVDLCLRGRRAGWRHVLATKCFVFHVNAASFGASKVARKAAARVVLDRRYPEYGSLLKGFSRDPAMVAFRSRVETVWRRLGAAAPRGLRVLGDGSALASEWRRIAAAGADRQWLLLSARGRDLRLHGVGRKGLELIEQRRINGAVGPFAPYGDGYDDLVARWLLEFAIEAIEIRDLEGHGAGLAKLAEDMDIPVSVHLDDAYPICPTRGLVDERGRHCHGRCTNSGGECLGQQDPLGRVLKHQHIHAWQAAYGDALKRVERVHVASVALRDQLTDLYPRIDPRRITPGQADSSGAPSAHLSAAPTRVRVGVLCARARAFAEAGLHNRILAPLTHPDLRRHLGTDVEVVMLEDLGGGDVDIVIIPCLGEDKSRQTKRLLDRLGGGRPRLIVAIDDDHCGGKPGRASATAALLQAASQVWTDDARTGQSAPAVAHRCHPIPTTLDLRLWPGSRQPSMRAPDTPLRLLLRPLGDDASATGMVLGALDRVVAESGIPLRLVVVGGPARAMAKRPWLKWIGVPNGVAASYPLYANWLAGQGPFDVAILSRSARPIPAGCDTGACGAGGRLRDRCPRRYRGSAQRFGADANGGVDIGRGPCGCPDRGPGGLDTGVPDPGPVALDLAGPLDRHDGSRATRIIASRLAELIAPIGGR